MSMHVAVGHALDAITEIRIDEKVAWSGYVNQNAPININQPNLFGGQQKEGGLVGTVQVLLGGPEQVLPAPAANRYGRAPNDCPAFRGITTLMFHGNGVVSTGRANDFSVLGYIVDQLGQPVYNADGFLWKSNSPVIAQKIEVTGVRSPKGLDQTHALSVDDDANFAHIIYECLTNTDWGMGGLPSLINKAGFEAAAVRLADEGMFGSIWWMRQSTIEDFVVEMVSHIQATLFLNPNSGLLDIKLLRDDYDVADLRHITPQNAVLSNFKRRSGGEIVNEMTVDFTNPITEQTESITAQDIASIQSQGGEKVSGNRSYYAFRNRDLATKALQRDLRASTAPLISADAALDRSAWDLLPGEVVLMSWPKRSTYSAVMRIGKVNYGKPLDSKIRTSMLQDVFSLAQPPIALLPETEWPDPRVDPQPLKMQLFTVPAYFARNGELQTSSVDLADTEALVGAVADSETYDSFDYELVSQSATAAGDVVFTSKGAMSMTGLVILPATMAAAATSTLPRALYPIPDEAPRVGGFVLLGYGDANQEFCLVVEQTVDGWTIARGCLDTVPKTWAPGTPAWTINPGSKIVDNQTIHGEGTTATYRGLDRTARGLLGIEQAPPVSTVVTNRPHLPLRPANVRVNGVGFGSLAIGGAANIVVTWATRNRELEDTQVMRWSDGPVQPEHRQETVVQVVNAATNDLIVEYGSLWTDTQLVLPKTSFDRFAAVRFVVLSRRDGEDSLARHAITVTGFANNPNAPLPPTAPVRQEPPSFYPAPAADAFVCEPTANLSKDGSQTPTLTFKGRQDRLEATSMTYRWRIAGSGSQFYLGNIVPLNREYVEFTEAGVPGETELEVGVAYVSDAGPGIWRSLPPVTTLPFKASIPSAVVEQIKQELAAILDGTKATEELAEVVIETILNERDSLEAEAAQRIKDLLGEAAARGEAVALAIQESKTYTDDFKSESALTFATINAMNGGLAATLNEARSYTTGQVSAALLTLYTKAQTDAGFASTLQSARSYTDAYKSEANLTFSTKAERESGDASAILQAKSYTDAFKSEASVTYVTTAAMGAANASTLANAQSYSDGKIATALNDVYTKTQTDAGNASTLQSAKSYTDALQSYSNLTFSTKAELNGVSGQAALALSTAVSADGKVKAKFGLATQVGNLISGIESENNGLVAYVRILSSIFSLLSTGSSDRADFADGIWYFYDGAGTTRAMVGRPFGGSHKLVLWCGPSSVSVGAEGKGNAYVYISMNTVDGGRFGGSDVAGGAAPLGATASPDLAQGSRPGAGTVQTNTVTINVTGQNAAAATVRWLKTDEIGGQVDVIQNGRQAYFVGNVAAGGLTRAIYLAVVTAPGGLSATVVVDVQLTDSN